MSLSWRARRRWALAILLVGLPVYVVLAVSLVARLDRPSLWVELLIYVALGVIWAVPFRFVFQGVSRPDPDVSGGDDGRRPGGR